MSETFKVLFLGDLVGRPGREAVEKWFKNEINFSDIKGISAPYLPLANVGEEVKLPSKDDFDFVIANVENASHGFGLTAKNHQELYELGIHCMTSGNHIWDKKDVYTYIDESEILIRPQNYHKTARGVGYRIFNDKVIVINLLGKTFMQPVVCPFQSLYDTLFEIKDKTSLEDKIIIVDFHAEATAEKICFAHYAKMLGVSAVFGTHTHVQTGDEKLIENDFELSEEFDFFKSGFQFNKKEKMAYITDAGFCGSYESVIGMEYESSLKKLVTSIPERFDVAVSENRQINAVTAEFDKETGAALKIGRINFDFKDVRVEE